MFTGIVTAVGTVAKATRETLKDSRTVAGNPKGLPDGRGKREAGLGLTIRAPYRGLKRGESIAVNGACLTVEKVVPGGFRVHVVETTEDRTLFAEYARGRRVNLERALRAADRLGGHLVQGHVDGVAEVVRTTGREGGGGGDVLVCDLRVPRGVREVCMPQGSITVDGVSLTINALPGPDLVQIALIPFTRAHTTLGALRVGERVHVEGDLVGKYVRQLCGTER
jgi:riboflavin synthase